MTQQHLRPEKRMCTCVQSFIFCYKTFLIKCVHYFSKLDCFIIVLQVPILLQQSSLHGTKNLISSYGHIHNTSFSSQLKIVPNKLDCYIKQGQKGFRGTETLTYCANSKATRKIRCCKCGSWANVITLFWHNLFHQRHIKL